MCNESVLGTATGPVKLRARFVPEDIGIRWYDGNTQVNVSDTSKTCTYDTAINLPTTPTRTGYTFNGWKVRPQYDFSTLPVNHYGVIERVGKDIFNNNNKLRCSRCNNNICDSNLSCTSDTIFDDLKPKEWKVVTNYGTVYGMALCSSTPGDTMGETGTPNETQNSGPYCWCKLTGYIPNNSTTKYNPSNNVPWVFDTMANSCDNAACATRCGVLYYSVPGTRPLFTGLSES